MLTAAQLKSLLRTHHLHLRKRLGQHHLVDGGVIGRLMDRVALSKDDTVVEIGAGLGALTEPLAERVGCVVAVEVDAHIAALLAERMAPWTNVRVVQEDILEFPWGRHAGAMVVGAIPYHITSPILLSLSEHRRLLRDGWLIVQKEVAARLRAKPGTKSYGRLSVLGQYSWDIRAVTDISRSAFFPQPEVDSTCLHLRSHERPPVDVADEAAYFDVVKAAFGHRRKTLANCLREFGGRRMSRAQVEALLRGLELPISVRGEELSLEQFAALSNHLGPLNR